MWSSQFMIVSDLHLETPASRPAYADYDLEPRPECRHLCLLGDIGLVSNGRLFDFLERQLRKFEIIFYVIGNHEPYDTDYATAKEVLRSFADDVEQWQATGPVGRFILLDQTRFDISTDLTVLGCTLFSSIHPEQRNTSQMFITDFERIKGWTLEEHNKAHDSDLAWLNQQVRNITQMEPHRTLVVLTHYSPTISPEANSSRNLQDASGVLSAFATDLSAEECWNSPQVKLWAFGHTHFNCRYTDVSTGKLVITNQKGYGRAEAEGFETELVVELQSEKGARIVPQGKRLEQEASGSAQDKDNRVRSSKGPFPALRRMRRDLSFRSRKEGATHSKPT